MGGDEVSAKVKGHAGLGGILINQGTADQCSCTYVRSSMYIHMRMYFAKMADNVTQVKDTLKKIQKNLECPIW